MGQTVFVRKHSRVYAVQMTAERRNIVRAFDPNMWMADLNDATGVLHWPVWIVSAMLKTLGSKGCLWAAQDASIWVGTPGGSAGVPLDWWIVRNGPGDLESISPESFAKTCEEVLEHATI